MLRLPYAESYTRIEGEAEEVAAVEELDGREGFVVAPFGEGKTVVIGGNRTNRTNPTLPDPSPINTIDPIGPISPAGTIDPTGTISPMSPAYATAFRRCHTALLSGACRKIVLARQRMVEGPACQPEDLFFRACRLYPRVMVALVSTPQTGTWLAATPETLVARHGGQWHTVALAGTTLWRENIDWSAKNRREQAYVADFIESRLAGIAHHIERSEPHTVRAAHLAHLRTDFTFVPNSDIGAGDILARLHPTPAVCGLPQAEAMRTIVATEPEPRRYYAGFLGMLRQQGDTDIYVNLRCMEILSPTLFRLYAGGGLIAESDCQQEWQETQDKMRTMERLINS